MTIRNLDRIFRPDSVAVFGASTEAGSIGQVLVRNLIGGGFKGPVMPVNPRHRAVEGILTYPDAASLPVVPDLAVIATPPPTVPGLVAELGRRGTKGVVVITAGFGEGGRDEGERLRQAMLDAAKPHLLRVVGPNCVGVMAPGIGLNASFAHIAPKAGSIAFVAQSGAVLTAVLDWAAGRGIGFSHMVSVGDMSDVDVGDLLDYLALDGETTAILLYVEAITHARKFMSAARAAARAKPVIAIKAGRHAEGAKAAHSHTGALAGADAVYDAAFRRAGMLRVYDLDELFDAVETLAYAKAVRGNRLAIITNGGGIGVLATDSLIDFGGRLAELAPATIEKLNAVLPRTWSGGNPVDIIGDAPGRRYAAALEAVAADPAVDGILALNCPTAISSGVEAAEAVIATGVHKRRMVMTSWVGHLEAEPVRRRFAAAGIPSFATPNQAVRAFMHMADYRRNQEALMEAPPSMPELFTPDVAAVRGIVAPALADGRAVLTEPEAMAVLAAYGIPVARTLTAATPEQAGEAARRIGGPVALKILSPDITHKSDVGGVVLDLETPAAVVEEARAMNQRVARTAPKARLAGFTVGEMVRRPGAHELIVGLGEDAQFGPVVLFGQGGTAVEVIADRALTLPPLNLKLAHDAIRETRIFRQLRGYRDRPAAALDAIALTLVKVAQLAADIAEIGELDINPLLADAEGVVALDARVALHRATAAEGGRRFAIRPYPRELEETVTLDDGARMTLRPVRPEDAPALQEMFTRLSPEAVRMRFFAPLKRLDRMLAGRLSQIDYDREMALALTRPGPTDADEVLGVARIIADPDNERGEFAITVRSDWAGQGLGWLLMQHIIAYARKRGLGAVFGDVLAENRTMLRMCRELGFTLDSVANDPAVTRATLEL
jgi:acetyltransferase